MSKTNRRSTKGRRNKHVLKREGIFDDITAPIRALVKALDTTEAGLDAVAEELDAASQKLSSVASKMRAVAGGLGTVVDGTVLRNFR